MSNEALHSNQATGDQEDSSSHFLKKVRMAQPLREKDKLPMTDPTTEGFERQARPYIAIQVRAL